MSNGVLNFITADEAREIASKVVKSEVEKSLEEIFDEIQNTAELGDFELVYHLSYSSPKTIELVVDNLEQAGYCVETVPCPKGQATKLCVMWRKRRKVSINEN